MIESLVTVVAHVRLLSFLVHSLLLGSAVRQGFSRLGLRKHWILQVGLVMARQRRGVVEALVAMSAGVGLASSVDLLMLLKMALADKTLSAHIAFVWLLARVDPLVLSESGSSSKTLPTLNALVRFIS